MKWYAIENTSGQWWTGECWGDERAREMYESLDDLPDEIENLTLFVGWTDPLDAGYSDPDSDEYTILAKVRTL